MDSALPVARAAVVSLPGSGRRRGFFAQPLAGVFEVAEAFHGATQDWTPYFDAARFAEHYGRAPVPAEIGCAISHARVIRDFAAEAGADSDVLLVAEDDARFTEDFARVGRTL
ncbi:glycosyltransferase family 25 protein, partial [Pseudomonas aeruginosa]|nr:glycosyltransferase family 25 protein [Pseudomonas aeruginosa]